MAIKTVAEQLEEVQAAITAVMSAQAYTLDGRSVTKASLGALQTREEYLRRLYAKEQKTSQSVRAIDFSTGAYS